MFTPEAASAGEIRSASFPRENFTFNDYVDADIRELWAIGANQQGLQSKSKQTATEASIQQSATQTRMKREQNMVARWFVSGASKLATLIQAARLFKRKESPEGVLGGNDFGIVRVGTRVDPDVEMLLAPYRYLRVG